jgi:hypothetical protein
MTSATPHHYHFCARRAAITLVLGALLASCGTEPNTDVAGAWSVTANYAGGAFACLVAATLTLNGTGSSVSWDFAQTQVNCTDNGIPVTIARDTTQVIGTVDGRKLSFTPQPPEGESPCALLNFEGQVAEDQVSGTVRTTPVFCQGTYVQMSGTWQAQRF